MSFCRQREKIASRKVYERNLKQHASGLRFNSHWWSVSPLEFTPKVRSYISDPSSLTFRQEDIVRTKPMYSSLLAGRDVDVFLSFCCETSDHRVLQDHLLGSGIQTFESISWGETRVRSVDQRTLKALEESKAVVMLSKREPCSVGFLEELIVILEFQEKGSLKVIPICLTPYPFVDVEEENSQLYPENAPSWRAALTKLSNIATEYPFSRNIKSMFLPDWLREVARDICLQVLSSTSNDLNALVAMDRHMEAVYELLGVSSDVNNNEVQTIGIWCSAGVGKTTLARYIYAKISVNFQTCVFLENVENMKDKILKSEDPTVMTSLDHDIMTKARRKHEKVLLVADGVNNIEQAVWIIEYAKWFAPGSKVALISQNKNLLVDAGVTDVYEVRTLRYDESLQLFSHFAFKQPNPPTDFELLAVHAVHLAGFLPLALRLLGSFLNGKGRQEWEAALLKLKAKQGGNILEVWKLMESPQ
uniref:TIR domain-containing protein n=3 Tax=Brassica oleracea TaxID=3712 RepID=A0A0D3C013_BRAOL|nr:unnamed protein product [Brassica oleracea]